MFSALLALVSATATVVIVVSTTNYRSDVAEEAINVCSSTAAWTAAVATMALALVGLPLVIGYLTSAQ